MQILFQHDTAARLAASRALSVPAAPVQILPFEVRHSAFVASQRSKSPAHPMAHPPLAVFLEEAHKPSLPRSTHKVPLPSFGGSSQPDGTAPPIYSTSATSRTTTFSSKAASSRLVNREPIKTSAQSSSNSHPNSILTSSPSHSATMTSRPSHRS